MGFFGRRQRDEYTPTIVDGELKAVRGRARIRIEATGEPRTVALEPYGNVFPLPAGESFILDVPVEDAADMFVELQPDGTVFAFGFPVHGPRFLLDSGGNILEEVITYRP